MKPGTRIRMDGPWPERVGCEGVVVDPKVFGGVYPGDKPFTKRRGEVIVKLDDDPLWNSRWNHDDRWTCVVEVEDVTVVSTTETTEEGT